MRKTILITLWISLIALCIAFGSLIVYQNNQKAAKEAELLRLEQEAAAQKAALEAAEAEQATESEPLDSTEASAEEIEYTFTDMEASMFATSKATVRTEPYSTAEIIGTLSLDQRISIVAVCDQTDFYKIKINGDYGYVSPDELSEEYIEIPLPLTGEVTVPSASKDILFIGNSITMYPASSDWWGAYWGCGASSIDRDYVHLTVAAKGYSSYDYMSLRSWEFSNTRNYELDDLDPYITNYQYSTIVIELGENVKGHEAHFKEDLTDMITYIRAFNPNARIVMLDNFWKYDSIIATKKAVASEQGITYVSLSDIQGVAEFQLQSGDTYTTPEGVTYTIGSFLAGHPNDAGFEQIAQRLISVL